MRVRWLAVVLPALLLGFLRAPARAEDGGEAPAASPEGPTKTDADHDFEWKLPHGWELLDPSESDTQAGFVAKAKRVVSQGVEVTAYVLVRDASGIDLAAATAEVTANKKKALPDAAVAQETVSWAGASDAVALRVAGKSSNGSSVVWFVRAAIVAGRYHQLDVRSVNGAHADVAGEIDAVIAGYKTSAGGGEAPTDGSGGGDATGAKSRFSRRYEKLGVTWKLPEGGTKELPPVKEGDEARKFEWGFTGAGKGDRDRGDAGLVGMAALLLNGAPCIEVQFLTLKANTSDPEPASLIRNEGNFDNLKQNFDGEPIPKTDEDTKLGNARGAYREMSGKSRQDGRPLWIRVYMTTLQKTLFQVVVVAYDGWEQKERDWMKGALDGFAWDDATVGIRGPLVAPFSTASGPRSEWVDLDKKKPFKGAATFNKPVGMGELKRSADQKGWLFAGEVRKGEAYLFVGIQRFDSAQFKGGNPPRGPESLIDDFEGEWKNNVDEPVTRPKSEKINKKPDAFRGAKGHSYEFSGKKGGFPFVENGWVVTAGKNTFWVRAQFGGKDAEKLLTGDWKDFAGSIRFE